MKKKVKRAKKPKSSRRPKRTRSAEPVTHAILFKFSSTNNRDYALKKVIDGGDRDVYYWATRKPAYYRWNGKTMKWDPERGRRKRVYKVGDRVVFVFYDSAQQAEALGVAIDFQQSIAPFDDNVSATVRMAAALRHPFETKDEGTLNAFMLAWDLDAIPFDGFELQNEGRYDYTVTLLSLPIVRPVGELPARRYWHDPEMDIGN